MTTLAMLFGFMGLTFGRLGAGTKVTPTPPPSNSFFLLADGASFFLLANGTDRLVLAGPPF